MRWILRLLAVMGTLATPAAADSAGDRLFDAMGLPALIAAFAEDGRQATPSIDANFLDGQGGDVFAEMVQGLYDPVRLEAEMRTSFKRTIDPADARQAVVFFNTDMGQRIVGLEVEARRAMVDDAVEAAAKSAADTRDPDVLRLISARDLVDINTDIAMAARVAFYDGLLDTAPEVDAPDIEGQRGAMAEESRAWVTGYYVLVASALEPNDLDTYVAFWETDVGQGVDTALSAAFEQSYVALSFGLGQVIGRLMVPSEL